MLFPFPLALFPFPFPFQSWAYGYSHSHGIPIGMGFPWGFPLPCTLLMQDYCQAHLQRAEKSIIQRCLPFSEQPLEIVMPNFTRILPVQWRRAIGRPPTTWIHQICRDTGVTATEALQLAEDRPFCVANNRNGGRIRLIASRHYYYYYYYYCLFIATKKRQKAFHYL